MKTIVFGICQRVDLAFWVFLDELTETEAAEFLTARPPSGFCKKVAEEGKTA